MSETELSVNEETSLAQTLDMSLDTDVSYFNEHKSEYFKVDRSVLGSLDGLLKAIPSALHFVTIDGDTYRVIYNKGIGILQKAANNPGYFRANVVQGSTNNKIVATALLREMSSAPQIISGIFSVMSIITGQYYMSQINNSLKNIEKDVALINKFLENDKLSKLESVEEFLKQTQASLIDILSNECRRQATLINVQTAKNNARSDIIFAKRQINNLKDLSPESDKADDIIKNINKISNLISLYWYSLYLYCFASTMEMALCQETNQGSIHIVLSDLENKYKQYQDDYRIYKSALDKYLSSAKSLKPNEWIESGKNAVFDYGTDLSAKLLITAFSYAAGGIDKHIKDSRKKQAYKELDSNLPKENMEALEMKKDELILFNSLYNGPLEIVFDGDDLYIGIKPE